MRKLKTLLILSLLAPSILSAETSVSGAIALDAVWTASSSPYILENVVSVSASTTLTIEAGVVVKGRNGGAGKLEVYGSLVAQGTSEAPVYFTSLLDDSVGGDTGSNGITTGAMKDWKGIYFGSGSHGNLDHVVVRYAGYVGAGTQSGIENQGGSVVLVNSSISDNYLRGINNRGGSISVTGSIIENHAYGLYGDDGEISVRNSIIRNNTIAGLDVYGVDSLTLVGNTFSSNQKTGRVGVATAFIHSGNASSDITNRGFELTGTITSDSTWQAGDLPIIIPNSNIVWVSASSTLRIDPSAVIKFGSSAQIIVQGRLISAGTAGSKIHFTSLKDDSLGGDTNNNGSVTSPSTMDWNGIEFRSGSVGEMAHTFVKYTGGFNGVSRAALYNLGGSVLLSNIAFSNSFVSDVYQTTGSTTISRSNFSPTGTQALINTGTGTLDARMNWWGRDTGPTHTSNATGTGYRITGSATYDPWLRRDPALPNPVIIVPGIISSTLINNDGEKWPNTVFMALSFDDLYLNDLILNEDGEDLTSIQANLIIRNFPGHNFFSGLFNGLVSSGYIEGNDLFEYPYDWRLDIGVSVQKLKERIDEIRSQTGAEAVDIIAHSMGGLLVKKYLADYGGSSVEKFIDIATPHTGAPKAFKILNYGDNFGFEKFGLDILNTHRTKIISKNMPSVYQLLPSQRYFDESGLNYYVFNGSNGNSRLTFTQTGDYLKTNGRNGVLIDRAKEFHEEIDNLNPADYGVETYNIVGCGIPTLGQFYILDDSVAHPIYNIKLIDGDGTVPLKSAEAMLASRTYYLRNTVHALMPSTSGIKELVVSLLNSSDEPNLSGFPNLSLDSSGCGIPNGKIVSFHSPIELHIYDSSNNHVGPNANGDIENNIPGVLYEEIDGNKFAYLPDGVNYVVKGSATNSGSFDVRIQTIVDGEVTSTSIFSDLPLTNRTQAQFDIGSSLPSQIYLDHEDDGIFESSYTVSTTTQGFLESSGKKDSFIVESSNGGGGRGSSSALISNDVARDVIELVPNLASVDTEKVSLFIPANDNQELVVEEEISEPTPPEIQYESTAIVYKSFTYKIITLLKKFWIWIISRL